MNIGERVGDYEIIEILGAGGMGQVYKVRNVVSERIEAMKVLLPNLESDPGLADRFLREIKTQAALDHPNIAKLNTAMRVGNQLVMIMEFVEGTSVAQLLERGGIPASASVSYASQVLDALAYAHKQGVVHRDIKPANIMVTPSGVAKLMDFGIARMKADQRMTQTGGAVGSLLYMSPEQIKGTEPDGRSDIYSLGITLYEMVTGRRPFTADSDFQLMSAHLMQAPVAPIEIIPGVPSDLNDIILMAIAKEPGQRFQSAEAFRGALNSLGMSPAPRIQTQTNPVPPTLPYAVPPPQSVPPEIIKKSMSGKRMMYMALGSVATLAVLIAAVIEGPKLMHGGSAGAQQIPVTAPVVQEPAPSAPIAQEPVAAPTPEPVSAPVARPAPQRLTPTNIVAPALAPVIHPAEHAPVQAAPAQVAPVPTTPAPRPNPAAADLSELRERYNSDSIRAATAKDGVASIEAQMSRQGLGLRGDIREARTRADYQLQEAMSALRSGDVEGAKQSLRYAESAIQTIEKFLGR